MSTAPRRRQHEARVRQHQGEWMMLVRRHRRRSRAPRAPPARANKHAGGGGAAAAAEAWRPRGRARRRWRRGAPRGARSPACCGRRTRARDERVRAQRHRRCERLCRARHRPAHGHTRSRARCRPRSTRRQLPCRARNRCEVHCPPHRAAPPLCGHPNEEDHSCQRGATQRCLPVTLHNVIVTPTVAARRRGCARAHSPRADLLHADLPRSAELPPPARADQPSTHRQRCGGRASCASRC